MLVLSRKFGETITIGDDIRVRVIGISGNRVRLAFDAAASYRIERGENRGRKETTSDSATIHAPMPLLPASQQH